MPTNFNSDERNDDLLEAFSVFTRDRLFEELEHILKHLKKPSAKKRCRRGTIIEILLLPGYSVN